VGGRRSQRPGPSPTLRSLRPSHHRRHKSRVSVRGPPCAHGVLGIPYGEVRDTNLPKIQSFSSHSALLRISIGLVPALRLQFDILCGKQEGFWWQPVDPERKQCSYQSKGLRTGVNLGAIEPVVLCILLQGRVRCHFLWS
jgi:hypothetical protein